VPHYGRSFRVTDAIKEGFAGEGTFEAHVWSTAFVLRRRLEKLLLSLKTNNPTEYRYLMQRRNNTSDLVQLAVAQRVGNQPMLGIIELQTTGVGNGLTSKTIVSGQLQAKY
jgi:hypothetical protein